MFNPQKFAQNLKNSTLKKEEQEAILELLPKLTNEQIDEIAQTLEKDVQQQKQIFKQVQLKADILESKAKKDLLKNQEEQK